MRPWFRHSELLLLSPVTFTTRYCFCFGSIPSFFLELFLHWSPVAYWAPIQSCGHCWVFQICWHIECSTFMKQIIITWYRTRGNYKFFYTLHGVYILESVVSYQGNKSTEQTVMFLHKGEEPIGCVGTERAKRSLVTVQLLSCQHKFGSGHPLNKPDSVLALKNPM